MDFRRLTYASTGDKGVSNTTLRRVARLPTLQSHSTRQRVMNRHTGHRVISVARVLMIFIALLAYPMLRRSQSTISSTTLTFT